MLCYAFQENDMGTYDQNSKIIYEIQVQGELDQSWKSYFNGLVITSMYTDGLPVTTLIAPVVDQPALRGLLCKLWDLNLSLISVLRVEPDIE
jgi:hypothetical protein